MGAYGITDAEFLHWLSMPDSLRCLLVEAQYHSGALGVQTRYLSNTGYVTKPAERPANTTYVDRVRSYPDFTASLSEVFTGRSSFGVGNLELDNSDGALDAWLLDGWDGQTIQIYLGEPSWKRADFRLVLSGVIADIIAPSRGTLALQLRDKTGALNVPIQTNLVGGSTANANLVKPLCFGQCFNVEPVLIDAATHTYQVHDGQINAITQVRDNGVSVGFSANLSAGTFTLSASPAGRITADVKGAAPSGVYLSKAADIASHIITTRSILTAADLDATSFSALAILAPQIVGRYVRDRENLVDVLDELLVSVGAWWAPDRNGLIRVGRFDAPGGTPAISMTANDIENGQIYIYRRELPPASLRLGYARNFAPQADGLAGSVTEANRALYAAESQVVAVTQSLPMHKLAPNPDVIPTMLAGAADAAIEAQRRLNLRTGVRTVLRVTAFCRPLYVRLGDVVQITHPRFGLEGGKLANVIRVVDHVLEGRTEVDLWL